jgi:multidrug efflux pump subunit AcrA (membrane-fusion protein)
VSGVRKLLLSVLLIIIVLSCGFGVAKVLERTAPQVQRTARTIPVQVVNTVELVPETRIEWITGYGTARPYLEATLQAEVAAAVVEVPEDVNAGSKVQAGQTLVQLDDRQYQEQFRRAKQLAAADDAEIAQLAVERDNLEKLVAIAKAKADLTGAEATRIRNLFRENNAAEREYNLVQIAHQDSLQNLQNLTNQIALIEPRRRRLEASRDARLNDAAVAQLNVERCRLIAPFDGQIEEIMVDVGDSVRMGSPVVHLMSLSRVEIPLEIPVSRRPRVAVGSECVLLVESMSNNTWQGVVSRLSPSADERSRTFAAYVEVDNDEQETDLLPGYFVQARVRGPLLKDVLVVPRGTIVDGHIYVARADIARRVPAQVRQLLEDEAVITGELKARERVIVSNLDVLYDGAPVREQAE